MSGYQILEHTADIGIRVEAATLEDLFTTAALGLQSIALGAEESFQSLSRYQIRAVGEDLESLLVNWLNEMVYYLDAKRLAASRFDVREMTGQSITADVWGESFAPARIRAGIVVKAATYHQLRIAFEDGRWIAQVYFDI